MITARTFDPWLSDLPRLVSPAAVETFVRVALSASTWPASRRRHHHDAQRPPAEFERLRRRVASACLRRLIRTGIGVVLSYALVISSFAGLSLFGLTTVVGP